MGGRGEVTGDSTLPGEPLDSGFRFRPSAEVPEAALSPEAKARVLAKIESVDAARRLALAESKTAVIG